MIKIKNKIVLFAICIPLLSACVTSKKVDKQILKKYSSKQQIQKSKLQDSISINSNLVSDKDKLSTTESSTSNLLPLLFYWQWDYKNICTLNPQIPINNFTAAVLNTANPLLKEKLIGQKLELTIERMPNRFTILDKAHLIFAIYAFGWDKVSIKAENTDLAVSYTLWKNNTEMKKGVITIAYPNDKMNLSMFKNWKTATSEYLNQYDANIATMSNSFVQKLVKEL